MKTSFKIAVAAVAGFVAGCAAGFFFQSTGVTDGSAAGNIAKVSKFSKSVVSPAMSAFQEKVTSNPEELKKATVSLTLLTSRMTEFDELVKIAAVASDGNEELAASLKNLQSLSQLAANARTNGTQALEALNAISEGKNTSVDYEQASQNLAIAFMMVDRQISVGKQYVCDVDAFLRGKKVEDYKELAMVRDLWAGYCAGEAVLTNNSEDLAYWSKQQTLLTSGTETLAETFVFENFNPGALLQCQEVDRTLGVIPDGPFLQNIEQFKEFGAGVGGGLLSNSEKMFEMPGVDGKLLLGMTEKFAGAGVVQEVLQNAMPSFQVSVVTGGKELTTLP